MKEVLPLYLYPASATMPRPSTLYGAIVTGLYRREKNRGWAVKVSTSLIGEGALGLPVDGSRRRWMAHPFPSCHRSRQNRTTRWRIHYATSDSRWLILTFVGEDKDWPGLVKALARPDLLTDPRFVDSAHRHANALELAQILNQEFAKRPLNYWREILDREHTTFGVVQTISEIAKDPQLIANDIIRPIEGATEDSGEFTIDSPIKIQSEDKVRPRPAPRLGQHSIEILQEMGYKLADILLLAHEGVIEVEQVKE